jgi:hypothetical protein
MSPELLEFPGQDKHFDASEVIRECPNLPASIDSLTNRWLRASHHPSAFPLTIAHLINTDTAPLGHEPIDFMAETGFGKKFTLKEARNFAAYQKEQIDVSKWLSSESLDTTPVEDSPFIQGLDAILEYAANPGVSAEIQQALYTLRRLWVLQETILAKQDASAHDSQAFEALARKLVVSFM